jgi:hypothetical protein
VRNLWFGWGLLLCAACTNKGVGSGSLQADFLPAVGDSVAPEEQPQLVFRCENGRLGAYLVVGTPAEVDSDKLDPRAVAVKLDSAPTC